jgi:hypothetical protein
MKIWLLTKTLKSSLLFILLLEAPSALTNILAYLLQSMLFFVVFVCLKPFFFFLSSVLSILFHHVFLYIYFILSYTGNYTSCCKFYLYNYRHYVQSIFLFFVFFFFFFFFLLKGNDFTNVVITCIQSHLQLLCK